MNGFAFLLILGIVAYVTGILHPYVCLGMIAIGAVGLIKTVFFAGSKY